MEEGSGLPTWAAGCGVRKLVHMPHPRYAMARISEANNDGLVRGLLVDCLYCGQ